MGDQMKFDYYYGIEAEQFSFYRVPRLLIKDERFKGLSSDAKLLYGLMLDRLSLSMKNGWFDDKNRAYIIYTVDNIIEDLGCARATAIKVMKELDSQRGIGLIEKKRRGLGKPDIIYVKNFVAIEEKATRVEEKPEVREEKKGEFQKPQSDISGGSEIELPEVRNLDFQKFINHTRRSSEIELQGVQKTDFMEFKNSTSESSDCEPTEVQSPDSNYTDLSYTDKNHTEWNQINLIHPSDSMPAKGFETAGFVSVPEKDGIDEMEKMNGYINLIRKNLEYEFHLEHDVPGDRELFEEIYALICNVVCVKRKSLRIGGTEYPYEQVRDQFLKLNHFHIEYVMECMKNTTTQITNIHAYLLTTLYNAPMTMNYYYQQAMQQGRMKWG